MLPLYNMNHVDYFINLLTMILNSTCLVFPTQKPAGPSYKVSQKLDCIATLQELSLALFPTLIIFPDLQPALTHLWALLDKTSGFHPRTSRSVVQSAWDALLPRVSLAGSFSSIKSKLFVPQRVSSPCSSHSVLSVFLLAGL